jgi:uncharacterized phage-associated protein
METTMLQPFDFDQNTAIHTLLYVATKVPSLTYHRLAKIMYYADRLHLERYGRFIFGGSYRAYNYGPVPHDLYGILRAAEKKPGGQSLLGPFRVFRQGQVPFIAALAAPDLDFLSQSDLICLDEAILCWGNKSFGELTSASHDAAWQSAWDNGQNSPILLEHIVKTLPNSEHLLLHLHEPQP